jgi:hypothetical protein
VILDKVCKDKYLAYPFILMKRLSLLIIIYSLCSILCPGVKAQWEGAQVQRLTYNTSQNGLTGFFIDKDDKLFLVYHQWWWDPYNQPYRDTLYLMTKAKDGEWSQPERISKDPYEMVSGQESCGKYVGFDPYTGVVHLFYDCSNETLYYTNSDMPDWEVVKTDSGPYRARPQAIKFDTLRNVHLVWNIKFDSLGQNWYRVMYANNSTGEWVKQQVSPPIWLGSYDPGYNPVFDVQKNGTVHIMYQGEPYCDTECVAFYARNDSLNSIHWDIDTVPKPSRLLWSYWAGPVKIDDNNVIHLLTGGCVAEDCVWPGLKRTFYYYKPVDDSLWQGPELIPDSLFTIFILSFFIDKECVPSLIEKEPSTYHLFFTSYKQGIWEHPNEFFDDTLYYTNYQFVIDSQGKGHGAYETYGLSGYSDALWYYGPPSSAVQDTSITYLKLNFQLLQNYPNPFNSFTIIRYSLNSMQPVQTYLKLYNILGKEVRELVNKRQVKGNYWVSWDGKDKQGKEVASGIYFYVLRAGEIQESHKMLMLK